MTTIHSIACALPRTEVTNADLARENPGWAIDAVAKRSGIESRRVAAADETAFDLSLAAWETLKRSGVAADDIQAILYCTHDPDYPMPGNAHLLQAELGLGDEVLAFDYRLGCSGFVYGLALGDSLMRAGVATGLLLVTAETLSKRMNAGDRASRALFGDGAAIAYLSAGEESGATIAGYELCSHGDGFKYGYIPAGGARTPSGEHTRRETTDASGNVRTLKDLHMDGARLWGFVSSTMPAHIERFLAKHSLGLDEIDVYIFHQASKLLVDSLAKSLSLPREKIFTHMKAIGNLSSASIPFALRAALDQGAIEPGDRVLLCGFGTGVSYGSAIVEYH